MSALFFIHVRPPIFFVEFNVEIHMTKFVNYNRILPPMNDVQKPPGPENNTANCSTSTVVSYF